MGKKAKTKGSKKDRRKDLAVVAPKAQAALSAARAPLAVPPAPVVPEAGVGVVGTPPESLGHMTVEPIELAARLAGLSTVLQRTIAAADTGDGLTRARLSALALLVLGGPRTLGELAAAERVRPPTMTRLVHAMEADGFVVREPNPADGRSIIIRATAAGEAQLEQGRARQVGPLAESIAELDAAQRLQLEDAAELLGRVLRTAGRGRVGVTS